MTAHATKRLPLVDLRRDGGTQVRETMNAATVQDYADALAEGAEFPAVTVFFDGEAHWLADGFHRVLAHQRAGLVDVLAEVRAGTKRDALWFALSANGKHGLQMSPADKRRAVTLALGNEEWATKSDRQIASHVGGVSHMTVRRIRAELSCNNVTPDAETRTGKDGKQYPVKKVTKPADSTPVPSAEPVHPAVAAIASAPTRDALDAAYTAANSAGLSGDAAEEAGKVYQRRLSEMRERDRLAALRAEGETVARDLDLTGEDADLGAIQQGIDEEAARRRSARDQAPATTHEQVDLFTQAAPAAPFPPAETHGEKATKETISPASPPATDAEVITLRAKVEALEAEVGAFRAWVATVEQRSLALAPTIKGAANLERIRRLIELAGSPSENEARNAAVTACRMIRDQGVKLLTSDPALLDDIHATNRLILETARKMGVRL